MNINTVWIINHIRWTAGLSGYRANICEVNIAAYVSREPKADIFGNNASELVTNRF